MTRRTRRDPEGVRRASVEHGRGKPRNQTQGGKAPRKPRSGRSSLPTPERRGATLKRRLGAVGRFGMKHRGSLTCVLGSVLAAVSLVAFEGTVQLLSLVFSLAVVGAGAAVHHHQRSRLMHRNPNVSTPTWSQRAAFEHSMRTGKPYEPRGGGPVHVSGSGRAAPHTRARPGEGRAA